MKRKLALLILMILALSAVLVACNQAETTKIEIRWTSDEYTFNITLADFVGTGNEFQYYPDGDDTYRKDVAMLGENFSTMDEIRPLDVDGTYTLSIQKAASDNFWTVTTNQTIYAQYNKSDVENSANWTDLQKIQITDADITSLTPFEDTVILKSTTTTEVLFKDTTDQTPISSKTEVDGFYVGKANQQVTQYTVKTTYDTSGKRPIASISVNDADPVEYKFARGAKFIDSNQMLMYIRSLEKSYTEGFPSSTAVTVFNPYTQQTQTAAFGLTYSANMILTDSKRAATDGDTQQATEVHTSINLVSVTIDNMAFMQQENLSNKLKSVDLLPGASQNSDKAKYTTVRFRVGYLAYELETYPDSVWNALNPGTNAEE